MVLTLQLQIPSGQALSNPLEISVNLGAVRIVMPDAWTSASLSFQISGDGGVTYQDLFHAVQTAQGSWTTYEVTLSPIVPNTSLLLPSVGANVGWLKLRSGTRSQPVNQAADRTFTLVLT